MIFSPRIYFSMMQTLFILFCLTCAVFIGRGPVLALLTLFFLWKVYRYWVLPRRFSSFYSDGRCLKTFLRELYKKTTPTVQGQATQLYNLATPWLTTLVCPGSSPRLLVNPDLDHHLSQNDWRILMAMNKRLIDSGVQDFGVTFYGLASPLRGLRQLMSALPKTMWSPWISKVTDRFCYGCARFLFAPLFNKQEEIVFELLEDPNFNNRDLDSLLSKLHYLRQVHKEGRPPMSLCLLEPLPDLCQWRQTPLFYKPMVSRSVIPTKGNQFA